MSSTRSGRVGRWVCGAAALGLLASFAAGGVERREGGTTAVIVPIKGTIDDVMYRSLQRRFAESTHRGAKVIVLELDTPGGMVTSALDICTLIKNASDVKTVAWVRPHAFSAGAMIAVACDEIVMSKSSRIGDCAPIMLSPTEGLQSLGETERAKAESPILAEFRDAAHRHGYDALLSESMVRIGHEIYWIEHATSGERRFVRKEDLSRFVPEQMARGDANETTSAPSGGWRLVERMRDPQLDRDLDVKQPILSPKELLTMKQNEAVWYGFAKGIAGSESELTELLGLTDVPARLETNWAEGVASWLSSPVVRSILFVLILMGAYAEFHAPGHLVGGIVALVALAIFLGAPYLTGLANVWEIVVIVLGIGLIAVEFFLTPGLLLPGLLGLALILVGVVSSFVQPEAPLPSAPGLPGVPDWFRWPRSVATWQGIRTGVSVVSGGLLASAVLAYLFSKLLPRAPVIGRVIAPNPTPESIEPDDPYPMAAQIGDIGVTETLLRPAGKARFGPILVDVVSESDYIESGARIQVIERFGNRVVVRRAPVARESGRG